MTKVAVPHRWDGKSTSKLLLDMYSFYRRHSAGGVPRIFFHMRGIGSVIFCSNSSVVLVCQLSFYVAAPIFYSRPLHKKISISVPVCFIINISLCLVHTIVSAVSMRTSYGGGKRANSPKSPRSGIHKAPRTPCL